MKNRSVSINAGGGGSLLSGCEAPAPVRESETGRARNWTMPPLRLERERKARTNSATIDNRCVEFDRRENQRCAFTMAEILLSLTIIGVVAAITLPSLTGNINERTWNTQRKALYARFSQAIALMPALNGYGTVKEESSSGAGDAVDTAAETFITSGLSKVLKINNICDSEHLEDCGLPAKITPMSGSAFDLPVDITNFNSLVTSVDNLFPGWSYNTKAAAFETANGESILVYYNPYCKSFLSFSGERFSAKPFVCANFVYDLNGAKGPNTAGKDIGFLSVLYPTDSVVVAPLPYINNSTNAVTRENLSKACSITDEGYRLPNKEELVSMFINKYLIGNMNYERYWSSSLNSSTSEGWYMNLNNGALSYVYDDESSWVRCVKR